MNYAHPNVFKLADTNVSGFGIRKEDFDSSLGIFVATNPGRMDCTITPLLRTSTAKSREYLSHSAFTNV